MHKLKCLISLVGVLRMDSVGDEVVLMIDSIEREVASRADQRVLRWFGHVKRIEGGYGVDRG